MSTKANQALVRRFFEQGFKEAAQGDLTLYSAKNPSYHPRRDDCVILHNQPFQINGQSFCLCQTIRVA